MARAILALGANLEDPAGTLDKAIDVLAGHRDIELRARSRTIVTPPWGITDQNEFHNAAIGVETGLAPIELLEVCLATETDLGRVRVQKWGPRLIDIDLVAYDRVEMHTERLTLPHPYAHERDFVLIPVREIAPEVADWLVQRRAGAVSLDSGQP